MKKILGIILLSLIFIPNVYAEELPIVTVGSFDAYTEEEIKIPIKLENNNQKLSCIGIKISFETENLEYISGKLKGLDKAMLKDISINNNIITLYALSPNELLEVNGEIGEINFKVKNDAKTSSLKIESVELGDEKLNLIEYNKKDGEVKIYEEQNINNEINLKDSISENEKEKNITWKTSDENVATIDETGKVIFKKEGSVTIEGTDEEGNIIVKKEYKIDDAKEKNGEPKKDYKIVIITTIGIIVILGTGLFIFKTKNHKNK